MGRNFIEFEQIMIVDCVLYKIKLKKFNSIISNNNQSTRKHKFPFSAQTPKSPGPTRENTSPSDRIQFTPALFLLQIWYGPLTLHTWATERRQQISLAVSANEQRALSVR